MEGVEQLREDLAAHRATGELHYPDELRERAAHLVHEAQAQGQAPKDIAQALTLSWTTLSRWARHFGPDSLQPLPVTVVSIAPPRQTTSDDRRAATPAWQPQGPAVVMPSGVRVEGLDLAQMVELLRRLS